jgi:outer membrane protein OmpA-like peptidoglycan-associated protein
VADYLIRKGIEQRRITTKGFGKTMPIESNDTPEGRKRNRRVEYRVLAD